MKHVPDQEQVKLAEALDLSRVDKNDRAEIRNVIINLVQYEIPMPRLTIDVYSTDGHYNICIKGWSQYLSGLKMYRTFLDPEHRGPEYESIIDYDICPVTEENVPIVKFKVRKSGFSKLKRRH